MDLDPDCTGTVINAAAECEEVSLCVSLCEHKVAVSDLLSVIHNSSNKGITCEIQCTHNSNTTN